MPSISSFNIRCYGLGGEYSGRFRDEKRNSYLKKFIHLHMSDCDAMVFQEIVDEETFKMLLPEGFITYTYEHSYQRHQKVVICVKDKYEFKASIIPNVILDEQFSRPAIYGTLICKETGDEVLNLIGVHLKSGHLHTENRLKQCNAINDFIKSLDSKAPTVITGDFNSQTKARTELEQDDAELMDKVFNTTRLSIVKNTDFTYHTNWETRVLDHFWVSKDLLPAVKLWVYNIQDYDGDINAYYKNISDHLPIKVSF